MSSNQAKAAIDSALQTLLTSNFDADTQHCVVTLMKVLDNVLQKPGNTKVRSIRLQNPAFHSKVASRTGGIDVLLACGFVQETETPGLLSTSSSTSTSSAEQYLVLRPEQEDTSVLILCRRLLTVTATHELGMTADQLPKYMAPPMASSTGTGTGTGTTGTNGQLSTASFDPYKGQRYDAKSAAVGQNLGPDANYKSVTETKLEALQKQEAKLVQNMQQRLSDRELCAFLNPQEQQQQQFTQPSTTTMPALTDTKSDASLLAALYSRQAEQRQRQQEGGFTTKAMRDLEQIQKKKVYAHVQLIIQFPDGSSVRGKFLPKETIAMVQQVLTESCFVQAPTAAAAAAAPVATTLPFDLYVTPPRTLLDPQKSLQDLGLVPASKVFLSWKISPPTGAAPGSFLRPQLFQRLGNATSTATSNSTAFPEAQTVVADRPAAAAAARTDPSAAESKPKKAKKSKEELLLERMMGGMGRK
jgi:hypothetical protein